MTEFQAVVLGVVQGLTEFLPISSSGHLVLIPDLFGWELQDISFDIGLHAGTALAVLYYFRSTWINMTKDFVLDAKSVFKTKILPHHNTLRRYTRLLLYIIFATIPVGIIALFFEKLAENFFRAPLSISIMLIIVSIVMLMADSFALKNKKNNSNISFKTYLIIALSQVIALIPGTSRSGITMSTGMFLGLTRKESAEVSFLLATPIILLAVLVKLPIILALSYSDLSVLLIGFVVSFFTGLFCIKWLLDYLMKHSLKWFIFYRILLAVFILWFFYYK